MEAAFFPKTIDCEFVCTSCGYRTSAVYHDPEAFPEPEPLPDKNKWVREQSLIRAQARLAKHSAKALRLVRCPACGAEDQAALKRTYLRAALPLIGVGPASFILGVIITAMVAPELSRRFVWFSELIALVGTAAVATFVVRYGRRKLIAESRAALRLLPAAGKSA